MVINLYMFPPLLKGLYLLLHHLAYINNKIFNIPVRSIILMKQAGRGFATGAVFVVRLKGVEKGGEL